MVGKYDFIVKHLTRKKMFSLKNVIFLVSILLFVRCNCKECQDNLSKHQSSIPYKDGDIVIYTNDIEGEEIDTANVIYSPVDEKYCNSITGKEPTMECSGSILLYVGAYEIVITQEPNYLGNHISTGTSFDNKKLNRGCLECGFFYKQTDTLDYQYKETTLKAYRFVFQSNVNIDNIEHCTSYIISENKKLLEYTMLKNNIEYVWKLK